MLYRQGNTSFVRKTAGTPEQNERLLQQSAKQRRLTRSGIAFPRVLAEGIDENSRAFFEMEYVPARSAAAMISDAEPFDQNELLKSLERILGLFRLTSGPAIPAAAFLEKIDQIVARAYRQESANGHTDAVAAIGARLRDMCWEGIPSSLGHGDLTLENVLMCRERGCLFIDCDDGWVSSYWLDMAKLLQDVLGHWCLRSLHLNGETGRTLLNAGQRMERLRPPLCSLAASLDRDMPARLPQLASLHLFRTIPYAKDRRLVSFVLARISNLLSDTDLRG